MKNLFLTLIFLVCFCSCNNICKYDTSEPITIEYYNEYNDKIIFNYDGNNVIEEYYKLYSNNITDTNMVYLCSDTIKNAHIIIDGNYVRVFVISPDGDHRIFKEFYFDNKTN